jgi:hypothetical protein
MGFKPQTANFSPPASEASMSPSTLGIAILGLLVNVTGAAAASAQSFGIAAGPAIEHSAPTGGLVQLSYFPTTAFRHIGLRFDGLYLLQPGQIVEGATPTGENSSFQQPSSHTYALLGAVSYHVGRGAVRPYALFGTGFYSRNAYTSGFTLGANAGAGADIRLAGLRLFTEVRVHEYRGPANVPWTSPDRVRLIPVTIGFRF